MTDDSTPKSYGTSNGVLVTDEVLARAAARAEAGYDVDKLVQRPAGRPLMGAAPAKALAVRLPPELRQLLQLRAATEGVSEAEVVRQAVTAWVKPPTQGRPRKGLTAKAPPVGVFHGTLADKPVGRKKTGASTAKSTSSTGATVTKSASSRRSPRADSGH